MKKASLLVRSGALQGQSCPVNVAAMTLGRSDDCSLILGGYERVSRHHARLEWDGPKLTITDQNSTNGVLVNGHKVTQATLKNGDHLDLGDFSATVTIEGSAPPSFGPANALVQRWNDWAIPKNQKWGVAAIAGVVLLLGLIGMTHREEVGPPPGPDITDPHTASKIPDASGTPVAQTLTATDPVNGQISPATIQNAKAATVLIAHRTANGYSMGSGFALGDSRHIVTNRHVVVDENGNPQDCLLIFEAGTPRERKITVPAQNIALAPNIDGPDAFQDDLASLTLDAGQTPALPAGKSEDLVEADEVYAIGFPLGTQVLTLNDDLPSVSVKPSNVERLQTDKSGAVTVIQLGSSVTHGNSGGPVINKRGEVVGVISSVVKGTTMAYAIPMVFVHKLP